jgi:hypothetical protein
LFLSTDENVGVLLLAPLEALGEDALGVAEELLGEDDEPLDAPPEALPEDLLSVALGVELEPEDLLSVALGLELEPEAPLLIPEPVLCANETLANAKSAAAVAVPTTLNMCEFLLGDWEDLQCDSMQ